MTDLNDCLATVMLRFRDVVELRASAGWQTPRPRLIGDEMTRINEALGSLALEQPCLIPGCSCTEDQRL